jgi:hypothetical protein
MQDCLPLAAAELAHLLLARLVVSQELVQNGGSIVLVHWPHIPDRFDQRVQLVCSVSCCWALWPTATLGRSLTTPALGFSLRCLPRPSCTGVTRTTVNDK